MIVLFTAGQLGNQIFQYAFAQKQCSPNEKIVTSRCDYFEIFEYNKQNYIFLSKGLRFITRRILKLLIHFRIVSFIRQNTIDLNDYRIETETYHEQKGLLSFIKVIDGFFQSDNFFDSVPKIKHIYIKQAQQYLCDIPKDHRAIFIHVRRGDYLTWNILGVDNPTLPLSYYKETLSIIRKEIDSPYFIFLSDDPDFIEKEFFDIQNKKISRNSVAVDLAIMTLCEGAILSNSTLSWWGACLMHNKKAIYAPEYWLGWQSNNWYPHGIKTDFIHYIKIKE